MRNLFHLPIAGVAALAFSSPSLLPVFAVVDSSADLGIVENQHKDSLKLVPTLQEAVTPIHAGSGVLIPITIEEKSDWPSNAKIPNDNSFLELDSEGSIFYTNFTGTTLAHRWRWSHSHHCHYYLLYRNCHYHRNYPRRRHRHH